MKFRTFVTSILILVFSLTAYAYDNTIHNVDDDEIYIKNEFENLLDLQSKSKSELQVYGYHEDEITEINSIDFKKEYGKLNNFSDQALMKKGYTNEQIQTIRNFKGTYDEMKSISAKLILTGELSDYYEYNGQQKFIEKFSWTWVGEPIVKNKDIIGIAWNQDFNLDCRDGKSSLSVTYEPLEGQYNADNHKINYEVYCAGENKAKSIFELVDGLSKNKTASFARHGSLLIHLYSPNGIDNTSMIVKYGHSSYSLNPSISIGKVAPSFTCGVTQKAKSICICYPEAN
jgi:hypothetical protein